MAAGIKELDRRIRSVKNTQQITRAMKMVAAAKLRRAQDRLMEGRPYAQTLANLLETLAGKNIDHPLFERRELQRRLVVVVGSDKGLCGGYNSNVNREAERWLRRDHGAVENQLYIVGRKANDYLRRRGFPIRTAITDVNGTIDLARFNAIADEMMAMFLGGEVDEVVVFYTRFISTLSYKPARTVLLPLAGEDREGADGAAGEAGASGAAGAAGASGAAGAGRGSGEYLYVPSAEEVLDRLLPKSVRNRFYHCLAEAITSEHGARMTSMGSATDNASELIESLTLFRNRARQAAITQEISEIVGGADAIS